MKSGRKVTSTHALSRINTVVGLHSKQDFKTESCMGQKWCMVRYSMRPKPSIVGPEQRNGGKCQRRFTVKSVV